MSDKVYVSALPNCDMHINMSGQPPTKAAYDGKTIMGPWAYMCDNCFSSYGVGLGTGRGQRLILPDKQ